MLLYARNMPRQHGLTLKMLGDKFVNLPKTLLCRLVSAYGEGSHKEPLAFTLSTCVCYHDCMRNPEQFIPTGKGEQPSQEYLDPHHFYAAYVFDNAAARRRDIAVLVHHPSLVEAVDLHDTLQQAAQKHKVTASELSALVFSWYGRLADRWRSEIATLSQDGYSFDNEARATLRPISP